MEEIATDRKPGRWLSLYGPAMLGALTAFSNLTCCDCEAMTFSRALMEAIGFAVVGFLLWWIIVMVCFHGYRFVRALFHHPN